MSECNHEGVRVGEVEVNSKGLLTGRVGLKCKDCGKTWTPAEAAKMPKLYPGGFSLGPIGGKLP